MTQAPALDLDAYWAPAHRQGFTGAGVTVGVIDAGADATIYERSRNLNAQARNYTGVDADWGRVDRMWPPGDASAEHLKHGTAVFLRLVVGARSSHFLDVRTLFPDTTEEALLRSAQAAVDAGADVLNMSLGRFIPNSEAARHAPGCKVCGLANRLPAERDVLIIAAAGNWGNQAMACPGLAENVLSTGSVRTPEVAAYYKKQPERELKDFLEGLTSTSFAAAMTSALFAVLRSAFPAISASDWIGFSHSNRAAHGAPVTFDAPDVVLSDLRSAIGAEWTPNFADWKEFVNEGIRNRRELVARAFGPGVPGYPKLREWFTDQRERFKLLIASQSTATDAREYAASFETLSEAIRKMSEAVAGFERLGQPIRTAATRTLLGSYLVNRSWRSLPGQAIVNDALEAERQISLACNELLNAKPPRRAMEASALAWRARARTVLAAVDAAKNEEAKTDAQKAVALLSSEPDSASVRHDLALAYLHLARAHYFDAWLQRQGGRSSARQAAAARDNAQLALQTNRQDGYVNADAGWLLQQEM